MLNDMTKLGDHRQLASTSISTIDVLNNYQLMQTLCCLADMVGLVEKARSLALWGGLFVRVHSRG